MQKCPKVKTSYQNLSYEHSRGQISFYVFLFSTISCLLKSNLFKLP